jgi:hypothetical protein
MVWAAFGAIWALNEKVAFDGPAKRIRVNSDASSISVKTDLYSAWKRWAQLDDHAKFQPAFRSIGGDPLGGGLFAGDLYFLLNGWQVVIDHPVSVNGVLYHDDGIPVFVIEPGGGVTSTVSNLTQTVEVNSGGTSGQNVTPEDLALITDAVWNAAARTLTTSLDPSTAQIVAAVVAALQATTIPVDTKKMNGADVIGTGAEGDPWRGVGVQP